MKFKKYRALALAVCVAALAVTQVVAAPNSFSSSIRLENWNDGPDVYELSDGSLVDLSALPAGGGATFVVKTNAKVKFLGNRDETFTDVNIYCEADADVTLEDMRFSAAVANVTPDEKIKSGITFSAGRQNVLRVIGKNDVKVLPSERQNKGFGAAVGVAADAALTISGEDRNKSFLTAFGENGGAGIGGGYDASSGTISIEKVTVTADGAGAGIGGGAGVANGGSSKNITVTDSTVTATGLAGAGIGGGAGSLENRSLGGAVPKELYGGNAGKISFNQSNVTAAGAGGAGIGGGAAGAVTAQSSRYYFNDGAAYKAYGGGFEGITVKDSAVSAKGRAGAGIGGGAANLPMSASETKKNTVTAVGGGIMKDIPLSGSIFIDSKSMAVVAESLTSAALGGGSAEASGLNAYATGGEAANITIYSGNLTLKSFNAAAVGGGAAISKGSSVSHATAGKGGNITVSGGVIEATASYGGAALGGGGSLAEGAKELMSKGGDGGVIQISAGTIKANAKSESFTARQPASIGGGAVLGGGNAIIKCDAKATKTGATGGSGGQILLSGGSYALNGSTTDGMSAVIGGGGVFSTFAKAAGLQAGSGGQIAVLPDTIITASTPAYARVVGGGSCMSQETINDTLSQIVILTKSSPLHAQNKYIPVSPKAYSAAALQNPFAGTSLPKTWNLGTPSATTPYKLSVFGLEEQALKFSN